MNNKHLLVKCITLIFQTSQLENKSDTISGLIEQTLEHVKLPEIVTGLETERDLLQNLMKTVRNLLKHVGEAISATELYQQIIIDCAEDHATREAIQSGIVPGLTEKEIAIMCSSIRRDLTQYNRDEKGKAILLSYADQIRFKSSEIADIPKTLLTLTGELEPYYSNSAEKDPAVVASFGLGDKKALLEVFDKIKERSLGLGGYRFGFKGINRFFKGAIEGGKSLVVGALQHQHKTGFTLALTRQLMVYNIPIIEDWEIKPQCVLDAETVIYSNYPEITSDTPQEVKDALEADLLALRKRPLPYTDDQAIFYHDPEANNRVAVRMKPGEDPYLGGKPKRKPMVLRISTEDEIEDNMEKLYRDTYGNVEKKAPDMRHVTTEDMSEYVAAQIQRNGWSMHVMRINPSEWTYRNIIQKVIDLENEGYDVRVCVVDYLPMIPTTGCEEGPAGHALRDMYRRVRNAMSARDILFITPHQLSSDAMKLIRQGVNDFVKNLPNRSYYSGSTQIAHEVDGEIFIHIEIINGVSWLTCQRGKYRSPKVVEEKDKYIALPFCPEYGLQDDLLGEELGRKSPGAGLLSNGLEDVPLWEGL